VSRNAPSTFMFSPSPICIFSSIMCGNRFPTLLRLFLLCLLRARKLSLVASSLSFKISNFLIFLKVYIPQSPGNPLFSFRGSFSLYDVRTWTWRFLDSESLRVWSGLRLFLLSFPTPLLISKWYYFSFLRRARTFFSSFSPFFSSAATHVIS